jgi:hypothetical protein
MTNAHAGSPPESVGNTDPETPETQGKRSRQVTEKPFRIMTNIDEEDLPDSMKPMADKIWVDLPPIEGIDSTAKALKYIAENDDYDAGRYRVIQLCTEKTKKVKKVITAELTD